MFLLFGKRKIRQTLELQLFSEKMLTRICVQNRINHRILQIVL